MDIDKLITVHQGQWRSESFLPQLNRGTLRALLSAGRVVQFKASEALITEGQDDTSVFLLVSSCVKITARLNDVDEALLAVRFGGDVVGELAAVDGQRRSATVRACGRAPVVAVQLDRDMFSGQLTRDTAASLILSAAISGKLRSATQRRVDYTGCSSTIRVARVLIELATTYGDTSIGRGTIIGVDLTQIELGTLVGVKHATAERALRDLRQAELIDTGGKRLLIRDLANLRRLAYEAAEPGPSIEGSLG